MLILIPIIFVITMGLVSSFTNPDFSDALTTLVSPLDDTGFLEMLVSVGEKVAALGTLIASLIVPTQFCMYGQCSSTAIFAVFNLGMYAMMALYWKDTIIALVGGAMPGA